MQELLLYYRPTCPFCRKVLAFLDENNISLELRDISEDEKNLQDLVKIAGKQQVPCLFIDGNPMFESDDIVGWLKNNVLEN